MWGFPSSLTSGDTENIYIYCLLLYKPIDDLEYKDLHTQGFM